MALKGVCLCCGHETSVSFESGKKWEQCADSRCNAAFENGMPAQPPKDASADVLRALACCHDKSPEMLQAEAKAKAGR